MKTFARLQNLPILFDRLALQTLPTHIQHLIARIDEQLPQTQCGLCGHIDGCLPYAYDIAVQGQAHNLCVPGGQAVTNALANLLNSHRPIEQKSAIASKWATDPSTNRPIQVKAIIVEEDCIGCTKCIPACPVDAIIGTAKHMHTIVADLCTGCELCLTPCPVDCIQIIPHKHTLTNEQRTAEQEQLRHRYHHHLNRVAKTIQDGNKPVVNTVESTLTNVLTSTHNTHIDKDHAKITIELAKLRTQIKKLNKQLVVHPNPYTQTQLDELNTQLTALESQLHHE